MAALMNSIYTNYKFVVDDLSDPRVKDLPLMSSPMPILLIMIVYVFYVNRIGPSIMESRKPFDFKYTLIIYNMVQIAFNAFIVIKIVFLVWLPGLYSLTCGEMNFSDDPAVVTFLWYTWLFFLSKILDLLDTVFMVLRKKQRQVTFLHVYHHAGMVLATWIHAKYLRGGHTSFLGWINAFVHSIMYAYYLLSSLYPEYKKNMWWKKYITQLQLVQFAVIILHGFIGLLNPDCNFPKLMIALIICQNIFMIVMFWDFYKKTYLRRKDDADPMSSTGKSTSNNVKED